PSASMINRRSTLTKSTIYGAITCCRRNLMEGSRRSRSMDHSRRSAAVGFARISRARSRSSRARWRSSFEGTPLTLPPLSGSFPLPVRGEGLFTADLTRIAGFVEGDEGELALRHDGLGFAVPSPRDGPGLA